MQTMAACSRRTYALNQPRAQRISDAGERPRRTVILSEASCAPGTGDSHERRRRIETPPSSRRSKGGANHVARNSTGPSTTFHCFPPDFAQDVRLRPSSAFAATLTFLPQSA
jgi:hypothetical protein